MLVQSAEMHWNLNPGLHHSAQSTEREQILFPDAKGRPRRQVSFSSRVSPHAL